MYTLTQFRVCIYIEKYDLSNENHYKFLYFIGKELMEKKKK